MSVPLSDTWACVPRPAEGQRQPVQVVEGNYEVAWGTCAWWDGVRRGQ